MKLKVSNLSKVFWTIGCARPQQYLLCIARCNTAIKHVSSRDYKVMCATWYLSLTCIAYRQVNYVYNAAICLWECVVQKQNLCHVLMPHVWSFSFFCQVFLVLHFKTHPKAPYQAHIFTVVSVRVCANTLIEDFAFERVQIKFYQINFGIFGLLETWIMPD